MTLPIRTSHIKYYLANNGVRASQTDNNVRVKANPLNLIETFDKPEDIVAIVERLCEWLLPVQNEISEELKIPIGTVKAQLFRSREQLFKILAGKKDSF